MADGIVSPKFGDVVIRENDEGVLEIVEPVPDVVLVSRDLLRQIVADLNELRALRRHES